MCFNDVLTFSFKKKIPICFLIIFEYVECTKNKKVTKEKVVEFFLFDLDS